jgi:hypothetical protein
MGRGSQSEREVQKGLEILCVRFLGKPVSLKGVRILQWQLGFIVNILPLFYVTQFEVQLSHLISQLKKLDDRVFTEFTRKIIYLIN